MAADKEKTKLFSEFEPVSTESWEKLIEQDLKGADYNQRLVWRSVDGITVRPYFRSEDLEGLGFIDSLPGQYPFVRGTKTNSNDWLIRQYIDFENAEQALEKANLMIKGGVQSIAFNFRDHLSPGNLAGFLSKLPLNDREVTLCGADTADIPEVLELLTGEKGFGKSDLKIHWDWDPLADFSMSGKLGDEDEIYERMASLIKKVRDYPGVKILSVHGNYFRQAGSKFVQELGFSLAVANEYLAEMSELGISADETSSRMVFNYANGSNYFLELSKLRAARMLWARITGEYPEVKKTGPAMYLHVETSPWNKTVYDPYVNMLRTTTEGMSAVLGGVDSLTIHPFDSPYKTPDDFSERLARNQQLILKHEAYFDKVVDPGGGSYYIEKLTDSISAEAWKLFQEVERRGGYAEAFLNGYIQNEIATSAELRDKNIALRKEVLLGTNQFPDHNESLNPHADMSRIIAAVIDPSGADAQPLIPYRGAEGFESLRIATEKSGRRPKVFLLTTGNPVMRKARAGFAANFFGCGGYEVVDNQGFSNVREGMDAAGQAGADIIVLCSSDEEYAAIGPEAVSASNGDAIIVVAGYPQDIVSMLESRGIRHFIHLKTNVLEALRGFHKELGISMDN